jgi:diguanylate cyclase (GGDEF)-like protein/PAS domain S-box-containing protein
MSEISYETLLDSLFDGVYYVNTERQITYWNKAAERITGYPSTDVMGHCCADNILQHIDADGRELCREGCPLADTLQDGEVREVNVLLHHKKGHRVSIAVRVSPVRDKAGAITGAVEVFTDNSKALRLLEELKQLREEAQLDELTQLGNRRYGQTVLETRLHEFREFRIPFGVIFLDIDHFKQVNDTYGHQMGDDVLVMVANTLQGNVRKTDSTVRWGGEEFLVIISHATARIVKSIADRSRIFIQRSFLMIDAEKVSVTVSLGVTLVKSGDTLESIIQRADELMYASKSSGRNLVTIG